MSPNKRWKRVRQEMVQEVQFLARLYAEERLRW